MYAKSEISTYFFENTERKTLTPKKTKKIMTLELQLTSYKIKIS